MPVVCRSAAAPFDNDAIWIRTCSTGGESKEFYTEWDQSFESFDGMDLKENLLRGIYAYGESQPPRAGSKASHLSLPALVSFAAQCCARINILT